MTIDLISVYCLIVFISILQKIISIFYMKNKLTKLLLMKIKLF